MDTEKLNAVRRLDEKLQNEQLMVAQEYQENQSSDALDRLVEIHEIRSELKGVLNWSRG